ncbi:MAG TPA: HAD family hydrolase [Xanthobacteraceae bacterium]|jgi:2-haloacid dehalogenase|nr:HAD family hydrolase [Xanthobacteraceae bacterium]
MIPKLLSFDVFGTLFNTPAGCCDAFAGILRDSGGSGVDFAAFWEHWERRNIAHYWEPYRRYRDICEISLDETFAQFGLHGDARLIARYFDAFPRFALYPDVASTLERLARRCRLAVVSNIDDDLLAAAPLGHAFDLVCTAERARGYKPDGTLFRYLLAQASSRFGADRDDILHSGQSQFTDLVGAKPLGLTVAWINRRNLALDPSVPRPDYELPDLASLLSLVESP